MARGNYRYFVKKTDAGNEQQEVEHDEAAILARIDGFEISAERVTPQAAAQHKAVMRQVELWLAYLRGDYPCRPARIVHFLSNKPGWTVAQAQQTEIDYQVRMREWTD